MNLSEDQKPFSNDYIPRMHLGDDSHARGLDQAQRSYHQFQADILRLAQLVDISFPETFPKQPGFFGKIKWWVKLKGNRIASPLIRLYLFKQVRINQIVLTLATKVAALEARVNELEGSADLKRS